MNHLPSLAHRKLRDQVEQLEQRSFSGSAAAVHFAHAVLGTSRTSLDCDSCQTALPQQIESELNNRPSPDYRRIRCHIDLCPACSEIYLDLLEVALLAEEGPLPGPSLPIDLSFLEPPSGRSLLNV